MVSNLKEFGTIDANQNEVECKSLDFLGYPTYKIGKDGFVRSFRYGRWRIKRGSVMKSGHILILFPKIEGVKRYHYLIHHLVMLAFVGGCPEGMECRHLDGNPKNNTLENLKWGTRKENVADARKHGTMAIGEKCGGAKLTDDKVRDIRRLYASGDWTQKELGAQFSVDCSIISHVVNRKTWRHV